MARKIEKRPRRIHQQMQQFVLATVVLRSEGTTVCSFNGRHISMQTIAVTATVLFIHEKINIHKSVLRRPLSPK